MMSNENTACFNKIPSFSHREGFFGKTQTVSTPGAGLKFPSAKSWTSSPTIPRSPASIAASATSATS